MVKTDKVTIGTTSFIVTLVTVESNPPFTHVINVTINDVVYKIQCILV